MQIHHAKDDDGDNAKVSTVLRLNATELRTKSRSLRERSKLLKERNQKLAQETMELARKYDRLNVDRSPLLQTDLF
ncbi:MAG TPA: hypothetical protein VFR78_21760 [Pyrinomonadaceae bacterium]|nr:hypothetical protein [Pyrinomonadaceae bacterium]